MPCGSGPRRPSCCSCAPGWLATKGRYPSRPASSRRRWRPRRKTAGRWSSWPACGCGRTIRSRPPSFWRGRSTPRCARRSTPAKRRAGTCCAASWRLPRTTTRRPKRPSNGRWRSIPTRRGSTRRTATSGSRGASGKRPPGSSRRRLWPAAARRRRMPAQPGRTSASTACWRPTRRSTRRWPRTPRTPPISTGRAGWPTPSARATKPSASTTPRWRRSRIWWKRWRRRAWSTSGGWRSRKRRRSSRPR